jgi:hypothetical protein
MNSFNLKLAMGLFWLTVGLVIFGGALLLYFLKRGRIRKR